MGRQVALDHPGFQFQDGTVFELAPGQGAVELVEGSRA